MKPRKHSIGFALIALIALTACLPAIGEVAAKLDDEGTYVGMVFRIASPGRIWSSPALTFNRRPLNPTGDLLGDLAPTVVESTTSSRWPFAVWSHPNGGDYDLVFARFTGRSWSPMAFVELDNPYNDLDPRIAMNSASRPYMAWYRAEPGAGAIYFSIFMQSRWMTPVRVSTLGVDSRDPRITVLTDTRVVITFTTPSGVQTRMITMPNTDSITDDIDPKIRTQIGIE